MDINVTDARQLKAGRIILGMTIDDMAKASGLNRNSVLRVESFKTLPYHLDSARRIQIALEAQGVVFSIREGGYAEVSFKASETRQKLPRKTKAC